MNPASVMGQRDEDRPPIVFHRPYWTPKPRGTICVLRYSWGAREALAIEPQSAWAEWPGAFCLIQDEGAAR